jgi:hypothetical protein
MPSPEQVDRAAATVAELRERHHGRIVIDAVLPRLAGAKTADRERDPANVAMAAKLTVSSGFPLPSQNGGCSLVPAPDDASTHFEKKLQVSIGKHYTRKSDRK